MARLLSFVLVFTFFNHLQAQRYKNPQQYFREFQAEARKINKKNLLYLKASLRGADERKIAKYREMMIEQLKDSRKEIQMVGPFGSDEVLQREYVDGLTMFIDAYEHDFGIAEDLVKNRYRSYEDLKKYFDAVYKAEGEMLDATYKMEKAEDYFAKTHFFTLERDQETKDEYARLDEVTLYSRDMTLSFFRVEAQVKKYLELIKRNHMDSLSMVVSDLRGAIKESKAEVDKYSDFDGEDRLYREVDKYLEEMTDEMNETLAPLADKLQNEYLEDKEYQDAQKDLEHFIKRNASWVDDFFETKNKLIEDYLPED